VVSSLVKAMQQAIGSTKREGAGQEVVALSVGAQQHGLVVLDPKGEVIRPAKLWNDTESSIDADFLCTDCLHRNGSPRAGAFPSPPLPFRNSPGYGVASRNPLSESGECSYSRLAYLSVDRSICDRPWRRLRHGYWSLERIVIALTY